jgi:transposase
VIDSGRIVAEVARELGLNEGLLGRWVAEERRRVEVAAAHNEEPLTVAERTGLVRLRKQVAEQEKDLSFLKKGVPRSKDIALREPQLFVHWQFGAWP